MARETNEAEKSSRPMEARRTKQRIFDAALRLLREGGTKAATMRAICEEAKVTPPTLYHHFGDMPGLYGEVLKTIEENMRGEAVIHDFTPEERIEDTWRSHVEMARHEPGLFDLWARHLAWERLSATSLNAQKGLQQAFEKLSTSYQMKVTPEQAAFVFWAAAHGIACLIAASPHDGIPYPDGAAQALKDGALNAIFEVPPKLKPPKRKATNLVKSKATPSRRKG